MTHQTDRPGIGQGFGETLFGGTSNPQVVIIRSAFDELNNPEIVEQMIHEMFHAAGLHGSDPYTSKIWRNNDLNLGFNGLT